MREVVSQCPYFVGQRQISRVPEDRTSRVMSLAYGKDSFVAKLNLNTRICAVWSEPKDLQQAKSGSGGYAYSLCREQNIHFLVQKQ